MQGKKLEENVDYYLNEEGFFVFTEKYLLDRGYCCGNGCRHCPYDYENVRDISRQRQLRQQKEEEKRISPTQQSNK